MRYTLCIAKKVISVTIRFLKTLYNSHKLYPQANLKTNCNLVSKNHVFSSQECDKLNVCIFWYISFLRNNPNSHIFNATFVN